MNLHLEQPGWHTVMVPVLPYHPIPEAAVWLRVTLSDRHAPNAGGAGPDSGYTFGETEDYYLTDFGAWHTPALAAGQTGEQTFQGTGQFSYYDPYNPMQAGVVSVYPAGTGAAAQAELAAPVEVLITAAGFTPQFVDITAGQTVRWRNTTDGVHGVVGGSNVGVEPPLTRIWLPLTLRR
jgi:plastocyanin